MAKDPAVLFYTSDFITGTTFFTMEERGIYITLLCMQHQQGGIHEKDMINICCSPDSRVFQKFKQCDDGLYYNIRMRDETEKRKIYAESRRNNRIGKTKDKKKVDKISKTYVPHMENENENENINLSIDDNITEIQKFAYMCMNDTMSFVAPITQQLSHLGFETELLPEYLDEFNQNLLIEADTAKSYQDYRKHFKNWMSKKLLSTNSQPKSKNTDPNGKQIDRRLHPDFPSDYVYCDMNIYYHKQGKVDSMRKDGNFSEYKQPNK